MIDLNKLRSFVMPAPPKAGRQIKIQIHRDAEANAGDSIAIQRFEDASEAYRKAFLIGWQDYMAAREFRHAALFDSLSKKQQWGYEIGRLLAANVATAGIAQGLPRWHNPDKMPREIALAIALARQQLGVATPTPKPSVG